MQFLDRVVLVTGATSGIGRAAAVAFAKEGARVAVSGRNADRGDEVVRELRELGADAEFLQADLAERDAAERIVAATVRRFGRLDCAFNNAAEVDSGRFLADTTEAEFDRIVDVDLRSVWSCTKHEIRAMLAQERPGGAIVNTATINALGGVPGGSLYAMAKAGVVSLTKSAALEYAKQNIRVNALVPGGFRTPMLEGVMDRAAGGDPERRAQVEQAVNAYIALGRIGDPVEAAAAAVWLCSDAASYLTGHSLIVDGGMTAPYR